LKLTRTYSRASAGPTTYISFKYARITTSLLVDDTFDKIGCIVAEKELILMGLPDGLLDLTAF
jgi:hypothetical protein